MPDVTVVLRQTYQAQQVRNVLVFNNFREPEPDIQEFADAIRMGFDTTVKQYLSTAWRLDSIDVVYNDTAPVYTINVPFTAGALTGTSANLPTANQSSLLVSTVYAGQPPNRGRIYFAGVTGEQMTAGGLWVSAPGLAFQTMVTAWLNGITTDTNQMFLRIARRDVAGLIDISSPVTSCQYRGIPATQRRRRIGQGA